MSSLGCPVGGRDNLGVPRNPFYTEPTYNSDGYNWVDTGLGGFLKTAGYSETVYMAEWGKHNTVARRFRRLSDDGQIYRQPLEAALKKLKNEK